MKHPIIEEIKKEFYINSLLNTPASIECVDAGMVVFCINEKDGSRHELTIIVKYMEFWNGMTPAEIISSKDIIFLEHKFYGKLDKIAKEPFELIARKTYRKCDYE